MLKKPWKKHLRARILRNSRNKLKKLKKNNLKLKRNLTAHVNTAEEARAAVDAVKYYPTGHRGIFSRSRPAGYGFSGSTADYVAEANRNTLVCSTEFPI